MNGIQVILFVILMISYKAEGRDYQFPTISKGYSCKPGTEVGTDDIPPTRTQSLENCFAYPATALADFDNCQTKKMTCSALGPSERYSLYDIMRLGVKPPKNLPETDRSTYRKLPSDRGGAAYRALVNLIVHFGRAATEACAPADILVSKLGSRQEQEKYQDDMWQKLEVVYKKHRDSIASCHDQECVGYKATVTADEFIDENKQITNLTNKQVLEALAEKSYEEFLSKLLVPEKCLKPSQTLIFQDALARIKDWPGDNPTSPPPLELIADILANKKKIAALEGICMVDPKPSSIKNCPTTHSVVIHKYCEMCKPGGKDCKKAVKIQNSWGQSWQDANNQGWMDAEALLERTGYKEKNPTLVWIEGSKKL